MFIPLKWFTDFIVYNLFSLSSASKTAEILYFFIYNSLKVYIIILILGFIIGLLRCNLTPDKIQKILRTKKAGAGNIIAAIIGVVTPVDSFTVVPIFISFLESGVPSGVAFTYLVTAPITSEVVFALFWGLLGLKAGLVYYAAGITTGIISGLLIGAFKLDRYIDPVVYQNGIDMANFCKNQSLNAKIKEATGNSLVFLKNIWFYVLIGVGLAALINNFIPSSFITKYVGLHNPLAVPVAVILVIFFYINIAAALPIITVLVHHGLPVGTVIAFTLAVSATSIPELIILKRALKLPLLIIYVTLLLILITMAGYIMNFLL